MDILTLYCRMSVQLGRDSIISVSLCCSGNVRCFLKLSELAVCLIFR